MVASTMYHDSSVVIIDLGESVNGGTQPWLEMTTYLLDMADGQTTAIIAQTDRPTSGITQTPVPFTPVNAGVAPGAAAPTAATSTSSPSSAQATTKSSTTTTAMGVSGGVICMIFIATIYYFYRRYRRRSRLREDKKIFESPSSLSTSPLPSPNTLEKGGKYAPSSTKARAKKGGESVGSFSEKTNWDAFVEDVKKEYERFDESKASSTENYGSHVGEGSNQGGFHETASLRQERLYRLRAQNHSPPPQAGNREPSKILSAFGGSSPPPLRQSESGEVRELISILKRPLTTPADAAAESAPTAIKGWFPTIQTMFGREGETYKPTFAEEKPPVRRKGVTFGDNEVREFGRTPIPSRSTSMASRSVDSQ
ncbi:hypothetical protein MMC08_007896 [Hypocenomyce scalaris]|nr:hypothetical protein [Hypocenomyce scalaris]